MAKKTAQKNRTWVVSLIRNHGQFLGYVEAPDREAAETAAVVITLSESHRSRAVRNVEN